MASPDQPGTRHHSAVDNAKALKASLEATGSVFEALRVSDAALAGLKVNVETDLEIWATPRLIKALRRRSASLELILTDQSLRPFLVLDEFKGKIKVSFRSDDAALVIEQTANFNLHALFYSRSFLHIGKASSCNSCTATLSDASIVIGEDCMLSHGVTLQASDQHDIISLDTGKVLNTKRSIVLNRHVWVGKEAYLGAGCVVGENSIIGARSVVVGAVEACAVAAGNPARVIKRQVTWTREFTPAPGA